VGVVGDGLGVAVAETLGEAVPPFLGWPPREIITPAATAAPTSTTAPTMIKISRPREPDGPEPCPPDVGGAPPPPGPLVP
jgi:hypothetical protein